MAFHRGVKRMVWGGILFAVVSPLIFVLALVLGLLSTLGPIGDLDRLPPGGTAPLDAGEQLVLFIDGAQSSAPTSCAVTGPNGAPVTLTPSTGTSVSINGADWREAYQFTAAATGDHTVTCTDVDSLLVDRGMADRVARGLGLSVAAAFILPFLTGVAGAWLFIWGLVRYRAAKRQPPTVYPEPSHPPAGGPPTDLPEPPEPGARRPGEAPPPPVPPTSSYEPPRT